MRSEKEMYDLILNFAEKDDRVRGVYLNGSRANPKVKKDKYQDFDIVFVVNDVKYFKENKDFINYFGEIAICQEPDYIDILSHDYDPSKFNFTKKYVYLILFKDGNRIDLSIEDIELGVENILKDKMTICLLDKDNLFPKLPLPTDEDYHTKKPDEGMYFACCNEFWWCLNNVGKGLARNEIPYVMEMFNKYVRDMLNKMVNWYIGLENNFSVSPGKMGKYYLNYLPNELYQKYLLTYSDYKIENIWKSVFEACNLFCYLSKYISKKLNFSYLENDEINILNYLHKIYEKKELYNINKIIIKLSFILTFFVFRFLFLV